MDKMLILKWIIDYDFDKTTIYYRSLPYITDGCNCINCSNYEKACDFIAPEMEGLSKTLGIDLKKPCDLFYQMEYDDGTSSYWAGYDIIGIIRKGPDKVKINGKLLPETSKIAFTNEFEICFYTLPPITIDGAEYPRITLDFIGKFPRILKED